MAFQAKTTTPEQDAAIAAGWEAGRPRGELAKELGLSGDLVRHRYERLAKERDPDDVAIPPKPVKNAAVGRPGRRAPALDDEALRPVVELPFSAASIFLGGGFDLTDEESRKLAKDLNAALVYAPSWITQWLGKVAAPAKLGSDFASIVKVRLDALYRLQLDGAPTQAPPPPPPTFPRQVPPQHPPSANGNGHAEAPAMRDAAQNDLQSGTPLKAPPKRLPDGTTPFT